MKNSLAHLPKLKQNEIARIISVICDNCDDVEKIILFGSYARGNYKESSDLKADRKSGHISDYDILVVTSKATTALNTNLWYDISEKCRNLKLSADPRILTHDIAELNNKLSVGQYFYSDIKEEGIIIFDTKNFKLVDRRKLKVEEIHKFQKEYFEHWFDKAQFFLKDFNTNFKEAEINPKLLSQAAFHLHQTAEHAYKTILLVFTLYNPSEHFLEILGKECEQYSSELKKLFPKNTEEQKERFKILEYAYIGGRYDPKYKISKTDLEILAKDVEELLTITKKICEEKLSYITN